MSSLTVAALKDLCRAKELSTAGTKSEIINRLLEAGVPETTLQLSVATPSDAQGHTTDNENQEPRFDQQCDGRISEYDLLRREKELAEREIQLLRRELELARLTPASDNSSSAARSREARWNDAKEMIGDFDGNNFDIGIWEKQMRKLIASYGLDGFSAKALICHKLKGKALRWYHSKSDCVDLDYDQLLYELCGMFGQRPNTLSRRREFEQRVWKTTESFADYVHDKVVLGNRVPIANSEIVDYVIEGIPDQQFRSLASVQCFRTTEELARAFAKMTLPDQTRRSTPAVRREVNAPSTRNIAEHPDTKATRRVRCYNCNESGHYAAECKKPKRERGSCYKCGSKEHRVDRCQIVQDTVSYVAPPINEDQEFFPTVTLSLSDAKCELKSIQLNALIDSGSPISFVRESCIPRDFIHRLSGNDRFSGINGSVMRIVGYVNAKLSYRHAQYDVMLHAVVDGTMRNPLVLGRDFMKTAKISLKVADEVQEIMNIQVVSSDESQAPKLIIDEGIPHNTREQIQRLFEKEYVKPVRPDEPQTENVMKLTLTEDKPFHYSPRRLSHFEKAKLKTIKTHSIKKRYIFLVVDGFTKYLKLYATKTTSAAEVIKNLKAYFLAYSRPLRIVSDRGSCFTSREFGEFMQRENVKHVKIATASPQANGQVERYNRTIVPMIAKLADERGVPWYETLDDVEYACNNTINRSTGETPSMLLYGVRQRGSIIDNLRDALEATNPNVEDRDLTGRRDRAAETIVKNYAWNKMYYDKRHKPPDRYQVGDKVMIRNFENASDSAKLMPQFKGPYEIAKVLRHDRYIVKDIDGFQNTRVPYQGTWAAANMRPWIRT